jgi:putative flippase GtrA
MALFKTKRFSTFSLFSRFLSVGVINTAIHWLSFFALTYFGYGQARSNLIAFIIAVTFSFFANGKFTFKTNVSLGRYITFTTFMGALAYSLGFLADFWEVHELVTLVLFSGTSLVVGFLFSKYVVFKEV